MVLKEKISELLAGRTIVHLQSKSAVPAAVLIPLFMKEGSYHLLFTKRTESVSSHKGQISFPGGATHRHDSNSVFSALRETYEEIGVIPEDVEVLGQLDDMITISNYLVEPFVGVIPYPYQFRINKFEVEKILEVPMNILTDKSHYWSEINYGYGYPNPAYFYEYQGNIIWGVTAKILHQFLELMTVDHIL